ncbi:hypothetical protein CISG_07022 [Coccidioides immitis RMSCC 3703]|uniref:Uncharacterized protein n=1 Tax=Coccidioides immitis RMSCC 3703 TaxID=454286 RepID=A0A0J8TW94_COCIT|nr:hypothetical protein CISG_07022 [Coccidioides immitis RMSCC 3703]
MTSGRPPGGHPSAAGNNDLLQLDDTPVYGSGQRAPVNDDHLLERYDIDDSDLPSPRASVSYDEFVGGRHPSTRAGASSNVPHQDGLQPPSASSQFYGGGPATRTYSQTSDLHNYQRYSDIDDFDDERGYYPEADLDGDHLPIRDARARDRNNLPLTEAGARASADTVGTEGDPRPKSKSAALAISNSVSDEESQIRDARPRVIYLDT